ncbi:MAG: adenylate/guanylate cyclase domain-containing protein [Roseiarcus sp.]
MTFTWRRLLPALVGLAAILGLLAARGLRPEAFERARLFAFDTLQRLAPWEAPRPVVVVDIDDSSLTRIGQWPWSRDALADLVRALQDLGAGAIGFDVIFAEPDRTSPALLARQWERGFGWRPPGGAAAPPDYDAVLAAAIGRGRVATGFGLLAQANGAAPRIAASFATIGADPAATVRNFSGAVPNLAGIEAAAAGNGSLAIAGGGDEVIRAMPMLSALDGRLAPSLAAELLRIAQDEDTIGVRAERAAGAGGAVTGYTLRIGDRDAPVDRDGALLLHHGPRPAAATIPAWRLLAPGEREALRARIDHQIVLIGTSALGLSDLRATPLRPLEPGVNLHARAIEQILAGHFLARPAFADGAEFVASALLAAALVLLAAFGAPRAAALAAALSVAGLFGASFAAFTTGGLLLDPGLPAATAVCAAVATSFARYFIADRDASRLRAAFTHYLSPTLVDALARDPDRLKLGGEQREMTFLFTDLEGFTSLTEAADPRDIVAWLNAYLDGLCRIVMDHGGTVDKIVGDAVHAMFNAPLDQPDHARRAVRCALAIDAFAQDYAQAQKALGIAFGATRIGVNTGLAVVGNFGGRRRFDYTAHGDAINTAARLEAANKTLGTRICVARATMEQVAAIEFLPVGALMLKGKSRPVDVFAPQAEPSATGAWAAAYREAFARLAEGDAAGSAAILALHERHPDQPILALHARRIRAGERSAAMAA